MHPNVISYGFLFPAYIQKRLNLASLGLGQLSVVSHGNFSWSGKASSLLTTDLFLKSSRKLHLLVESRICKDGKTKHVLTGDITLSADWLVQVATINKFPDCQSAPRTRENILRTTEHELVHRDSFMRHINAAKSALPSEYDTAEQCESILNQRKEKLEADINGEKERQKVHADHKGELRFYVDCVDGKAEEFQCLSGPNPTFCGANNVY